MLKHHYKELGGIVCKISAKCNHNMCGEKVGLARTDFYVARLKGTTPSHKMREPFSEGEGEGAIPNSVFLVEVEAG